MQPDLRLGADWLAPAARIGKGASSGCVRRPIAASDSGLAAQVPRCLRSPARRARRRSGRSQNAVLAHQRQEKRQHGADGRPVRLVDAVVHGHGEQIGARLGEGQRRAAKRTACWRRHRPADSLPAARRAPCWWPAVRREAQRWRAIRPAETPAPRAQLLLRRRRRRTRPASRRPRCPGGLRARRPLRECGRYPHPSCPK